MPNNDSSQDPRLQSESTYFISDDSPCIIRAEDWQGERLAGERIECVCGTEEEARAKLYELDEPARREALEWMERIKEYEEDIK